MKLSKKLFAAAATLGLAAAATVGSTYAWFSLNDQVAVTGMTATTKTENNLFVALDPSSEVNFDTEQNQSLSARLRPVSTVNGTSFFYTVSAKGDGSKKSGNYTAYSEDDGSAVATAGKTNWDADFNTAYKVTSPTASNAVFGYVDYTFYLKATSAEDNQKVYLSECLLQYSGGTLDAKDLSWRVAVLKSAAQDSTTDLTTAELTKLTILTLDGAANQNAGKAVSAEDAIAEVNYNTAATIDTIATAGTTSYFKVVVRLWLEGEDKSCTNQTYAELTSAYSLSLKFDIGAGTGVTNIIDETA